jgi:hypothetical protein
MVFIIVMMLVEVLIKHVHREHGLVVHIALQQIFVLVLENLIILLGILQESVVLQDPLALLVLWLVIIIPPEVLVVQAALVEGVEDMMFLLLLVLWDLLDLLAAQMQAQAAQEEQEE